MLIDNVTLVEGSSIESAPLAFGPDFPPAPTDKQRFEKTGSNAGKYVFSTVLSEWLPISNVEFNSYDISASVFDRPRSNDIVVRHIAARTFILRENFEGSAALANVAATSETIFVVRLNVDGVFTNIGTITFAANSGVGTFVGSASGEMILSEGVVLEIVAPEIRDSTLSTIAITMSGRLFV